jgi:hypothetical protein
MEENIMNVLTIQPRAFQDYDINCSKTGEESYGFSIFDNYSEKVYMDLDYKEFNEIMRSPQEILDLIMQFWDREFQAVLLKSGGFYISEKWYQIDSCGRVKNIA